MSFSDVNMFQTLSSQGWPIDTIALSASYLAMSLAVILVVKVSQLYRQERRETDALTAKGVPDLLSSLETFTRLQLSIVSGEEGKKLLWKNKARRAEAGVFLIGAVEYVVKTEALTSKQRHQLVVQLLQNCLDFTAKEISKSYSLALAACSQMNSKNVAKLGAKAYKSWQQSKDIKPEFCLVAAFC